MKVNEEKKPRPSELWERIVLIEHEQANRVRTTGDGGDHWKPLAHRFSADRMNEDRQDNTVDALMELIGPMDTVLDVGGGAGRIALPVAQRCREVVVVEPSDAMREQMAEQQRAWGLENVRAIGERWEDATVEPANVVICAHVVYTVQKIVPFISKLRESARKLVAIIVFEEPAMANYFPLWPLVYGEERTSLPAFTELREVLGEMGIAFGERRLAEWGPRGFPDRESAVQECMARLFISPGGDAESKLESVLDDVLRTEDGRLHFKWARPHRPWMVTFRPA